MKKMIPFVFIALIFLPCVVDAKETVLGLKLGMNLSTVSGDDIPDTKESILDWVGGAFVMIPLGKGISLQPEILYSREGLKYTADVNPSGSPIMADFNNVSEYIKIPILVKAVLPVKGLLRPNFFFGPYVSFLTKSTLKIELDDSLLEKRDIKEFSKNLDIGFVAGLGVDVNIGKSGTILMDIRYAMGMVTVNDHPDLGDSMYNRGFSAMVGYAIRL